MNAMVQTTGLRFPSPKTKTLALKGHRVAAARQILHPAEAGFRMTSIKRWTAGWRVDWGWLWFEPRSRKSARLGGLGSTQPPI